MYGAASRHVHLGVHEQAHTRRCCRDLLEEGGDDDVEHNDVGNEIEEDKVGFAPRAPARALASATAVCETVDHLSVPKSRELLVRDAPGEFQARQCQCSLSFLVQGVLEVVVHLPRRLAPTHLLLSLVLTQNDGDLLHKLMVISRPSNGLQDAHGGRTRLPFSV